MTLPPPHREAMNRLLIGAPKLAAISNAAAAAWPHEACGLLVGRRDGDAISVRQILTVPNVADTPERRFEVEPVALLAAHRAAREAGEEILGSWHSHPDGPARPSATDRARANVAGEIWLIVPVMDGRAGPARAYLFDGAAFTELAFAT
jgi:proteasome lid subunit RPN8/RPN11